MTTDPEPAAPTPSPTPDLPAPIVGPRATARSVKVADAVAGGVVRLGGTLVIVAVVGILVFLVATVLPLFRGANVTAASSVGKVPVDGQVRCLVIDEYRVLAAAVGEAPEVVVFRPDDPGHVVARFPIPGLETTRLSTAARSIRTKDLVVGTTDGRVAFLGLSFASDYALGTEGDALRRRIAYGRVETVDGAVVQRKAGGTMLRVRCVVEPRGVLDLPPGAGPVAAAAYATHEGEGVATVLGADGRAHVVRQGASEGEGAAATTFALEALEAGGMDVPGDLFTTLVDEELRNAWFVARDGVLLRVDVRSRPAVAREVRRTDAGDGARLTAAAFLLGDQSLVLGDDRGRVAMWSPVPLNARLAANRADPGDGRVVEKIRELEPYASPVVSIAACPTRLTYYLGHADGSITAAYAVNDRILARVQAFGGPVGAIAVGIKDDGLLVVGPGEGFRAFDVDAPHPETNLKALFLPVHYQGYAEKQLRYESSAGSDEAEPKLSLAPLLFGTFKATFYAMLFALPLALLGALYTSQFMHPRVRAVVKPAVEIMASLPSVVLGFVAALVLAPAIERVVPGVFAAVLSLGIVGFLAGLVWYVLPPEVRNGMGSGARLLIAAALVGSTCWLCVAQTPWIEHVLFQVRLQDGRTIADFRQWMDAPRSAAFGDGSSASGLPLLRVTLGAVAAVLGLFLLPRWLARVLPAALPNVARTAAQVVGCAVLPAVAFVLLAPLVEGAVFGGDFRWFLVGTDDPTHGIVLDQRNSLVVGIAMGFAVIPIIYTIAEDALSAIPDSLRSAALGCGASPWQASTRVVLPAAIPGIFSAGMIGFGRAIGETMIVLMAAGGTAIMDMTIFNGFRTLSVNIATELPEAPVEGTLYRVLFLAGLLLFGITFVLNTVAEGVRIRFRRRFKGL